MSKVIKSTKCIASLPYQLEPVEVDAFFYEEEEEVTTIDMEDLSEEEAAERVLEKARREADKIIAAAQHQAKQFMVQAEQEAVAMKEQAIQDGIATSRETARREWEAQITAALALTAKAEEERERRVTTSEAELLRLAVAIGEKIIGAELKLDPEKQVAIVRTALAKAVNSSHISIMVHPDDLALLTEKLPVLHEQFSEPKNIKIIADPAIATGNCFIKTEHGNVDARIKLQLERILTEMLKVVKTK